MGTLYATGQFIVWLTQTIDAIEAGKANGSHVILLDAMRNILIREGAQPVEVCILEAAE